MVRDIDFTQFATIFSRTNLVSVSGYDAMEAEGAGFGFHAGGDASWCSRAWLESVALPVTRRPLIDYLSEEHQSVSEAGSEV